MGLYVQNDMVQMTSYAVSGSFVNLFFADLWMNSADDSRISFFSSAVESACFD